jgi:hypothetical protein
MVNEISLIQGNVISPDKKGFYKITDKPFQISINEIPKESAVYIFAFNDDSFQKKFVIPSAIKNVTFFLPGTGMAVEINKKDGSIPLFICSKYSHNHVTEDRRSIKGNGALINISGIYEADKKIEGHMELYLIIFVDKNKNDIIDDGESAFLKIKL